MFFRAIQCNSKPEDLPMTFWASVDGALGVIMPINKQQFDHLAKIQVAIANVLETNGGKKIVNLQKSSVNSTISYCFIKCVIVFIV